MNTTQSAQSTQVRRFTANEVADVIAARNLIRDFERFLLDRFAAYTRFTQVYDIKDRPVDPISDVTARTNAGFGYWRLQANWLDKMLELPVTGDETDGVVPVEKYVADDRGPGSVTTKVEVPLSFVFGDMEQSVEYAEYLRLKAKFEPGGPTS